MTVKVLLREGEGWRRERRGRNREEKGEGEWHLGLIFRIGFWGRRRKKKLSFFIAKILTQNSNENN